MTEKWYISDYLNKMIMKLYMIFRGVVIFTQVLFLLYLILFSLTFQHSLAHKTEIDA